MNPSMWATSGGNNGSDHGRSATPSSDASPSAVNDEAVGERHVNFTPSTELKTAQPRSPRRGRSGGKELPPLFWYMESGDWEKAAERVRRHPREVKTWATIRTKSMTADDGNKVKGTKRLALHHACFKLRTAGALPPPTSKAAEDPFVEVCRFILMLVRSYPEAAGKRESRHGCLPLHLAAFASCAPRHSASDHVEVIKGLHRRNRSDPPDLLQKPAAVSKRTSSDATHVTTDTNMSAVHAEEDYTGAMSTVSLKDPHVSVSMRVGSGSGVGGGGGAHHKVDDVVPAKREEMLVQVINALLDAYPKGCKVDSEGGRLPLHTACAGRATPRVIHTLVTAYPAAARHRNKDGFLPLHLAAHWGVSHPAVAYTLLRTYPDATVGRNRWERTPLEEALCMAGENGRPHQAALVRALRKHPSWWTRASLPVGEWRATTGGRGAQQAAAAAAAARRTTSATAVDVDESLPSNESSTLEEQHYQFYDRYSNLMDDDGFEEDIPCCPHGEEVELALSSPPAPPSASDSPGLLRRMSPRTLLGKNRRKGDSLQEVAGPPLAAEESISLASLIEQRKWSTALVRIRENPLEAEQDLQVMTRGGFIANTGMTHLHYACERKPPVGVVHLLLEAFPIAALTRAMPGGALPLHVACIWGASAEVVKALLSSDHGTVKVKDELGNVALHSACFSGADAEVVRALLDVEGGARTVFARNHQGSRPMDICKRLRHENRRIVMDLLSRKKEEYLKSHRHSKSSGMLAEIAREAEEMNQRDGAPGASPASGYRDGDLDLQDQQAAGVEVTYDGQDNAEDLLWI